MMPDVKIEERNGWLVLAGVVVVALVALWIISDGGELAERAEQSRTGLATGGREDMATHVKRQEIANQDLRATIEHLKSQTDFVLAEEFVIPANERQPGRFFQVKRLVEVSEKLKNTADGSRIILNRDLGFPTDGTVPPDSEAPFLLVMLQLTEKVVGIALDTPIPLESINIKHFPAIETGPESRPALVREYPLRLEVRGGLKDILWILHRISQVDPPSPSGKRSDYPLILRGFSIKSENATPKDSISQLDAVFDLAAMHFISEEERAKDPLAPQPIGGFGSGGAFSGGKSVFRARP